MPAQPRFIVFVLILLAGGLLVLPACTGLKQAGGGKYLYCGSKIRFDSSQSPEHPKAVRKELLDLIPEKPNSKFLWMRPRLSFHNMIREPESDSGFAHKLKYKWGSPPVMLRDLDLQNLVRAMENRLQNRGYFTPAVSVAVDSSKKTARLLFTVSPGKSWRIHSVQYPPAGEGIEGAIHPLGDSSLVKPGNIYRLTDFENERVRIDNILKDKGYFYFNPDFLLFYADTVSVPGQVVVRLRVKQDAPQEAVTAYRYGNIYVFDDYSLKDYRPDTTTIGNFRYVSARHSFHPQVVLGAIRLEKDSLYSRSNYYRSIRQLMSLGIYKFAIARFSHEGDTNRLKANFLLTPFKKISLSAEMNANIKSTGFAGPGVKLGYKNRNALGGAELFQVTLGGNFESQLNGEAKGQTSFQLTLDASLTLPRFVPFSFGRNDGRLNSPKTIFATGFGVYSRVGLYDLRSFNGSVGYGWKSGERKSHLFRPVDVSYTNLFNSTADFEDYLNENPNVRRSFDEQFILGSSYTFTYSNFNAKKKHNIFISESIDLSGNLAEGIANLGGNSARSDDGRHYLLGVPFSQFIRVRNEERYFYTVSRSGQIGLRLNTGLGIPYGNSTTMPYNRQYFAGGTSSIRAFLARSLGPGTYQVPDSLSTIGVDQAGDIILESNLEYRFGIIQSFKGAFFLDAGNIWLVNEDSTRAGGKFQFNSFYKELAVGTGIGFRFDFTFIVLRFDIAFPLRKPWLPEGERWVIDEIDPGSSSWRRENIVVNFAIGYPF
jgi:outer membrane protein insertion porin family